MARKPTIADVAKRRVSPAVPSPSRSTAGPASPRRPSARILAAAAGARLARPAVPRRRCPSARPGALGLVLARETGAIGADPFFPAFIAGVESVLAARGDALVLHVTGPGERGSHLPPPGRRPPGRRRAPHRPARRRPAPGADPPDSACPPSWWASRRSAAACAPSSLDDRPAFAAAVAAWPSWATAASRTSPARRSSGTPAGAGRPGSRPCGRAGLPAGPRAARRLHRRGRRAGHPRTALARPSRPTAIVYANDLPPPPGSPSPRSWGSRVPGELSVVGYDDTPLAALHPPAARLRPRRRPRLGRAAARALDEVIAGGTADDVELPPAEFAAPRRRSAPPPAPDDPSPSARSPVRPRGRA